MIMDFLLILLGFLGVAFGVLFKVVFKIFGKDRNDDL